MSIGSFSYFFGTCNASRPRMYVPKANLKERGDERVKGESARDSARESESSERRNFYFPVVPLYSSSSSFIRESLTVQHQTSQHLHLSLDPRQPFRLTTNTYFEGALGTLAHQSSQLSFHIYTLLHDYALVFIAVESTEKSSNHLHPQPPWLPPQ